MKRIAKYYRLLNGDLLFLSVMIPQMIWFFMTFSNLDLYYEGTSYTTWPNQACVITMAFCFFSLVRHTTIFNNLLREEYVRKRPVAFKGRLLFLFGNKPFWIKAVIFFLIYCLFPLDWTFKSLADLVKDRMMSAKGILCAMALLIAVLAHLSAYRYWSYHPQKEKYTKKLYDRNGALISGMYVLVAYILAIVVSNIINLWPVVKEILAVEVIVCIVILLLIPLVYRCARAWRKRRNLLKKLKKITVEKRIALPKIKAPYSSVLFIKGEENFRLTIGERQYSCKLVGGLNKGVALIIREDGTLSFLHRLRTRAGTLFQYEVQHRCVYRSDCPKILIVNPTPKKLYTVKDGVMIEIDNGFSVGEYKVFTASGFLSAIEMDTLHR
ncbi:MAG: hypothetical protein IJ009_07360 [Clostridia bacterium]|nr:hypothetical protein [Clostridia bacterium]